MVGMVGGGGEGQMMSNNLSFFVDGEDGGDGGWGGEGQMMSNNLSFFVDIING